MSKKSPKVVIMGSLHGNERMGAIIIEKLQAKLSAQKLAGEVLFILGNPAAYAIDKRFVDVDLNRLFTSLDFIAKKNPKILSTEEKRVLEIAPMLADADYLLDIHSTLKPSVPFVYCADTPKHLALAKLFSVSNIVSKNPDFVADELVSAADDYVNSQGGIGLTFETGWHKDLSSVDMVLKKVEKFLYHVGCLKVNPEIGPSPEVDPPKHWLIYDHIIPPTPVFKFLKDFKNFDRIVANEVVAVDREREYSANQDSVIIFPKKDIVVDRSAGYFATEK